MAVGSLGRAEKNAAPVLIEPTGHGDDRNIKVSGDYKVRFLFSECVSFSDFRSTRQKDPSTQARVTRSL